jgi:two-component system sensor histidine kinase DegS
MELNKAGYTLFGIDKIYSDTNIMMFIKNNFIEELKEKNVIQEKEIEIARKNKEKRYGSIKVQIRNNKYIQGIIRDITDLKKRHEERLKTKRLIEEQIILAEERERRNIGQLIHEQLAQDIAFLHLKTEELYEKEKSNSVLQMLNTTDKMLKQIRGTIFDLCPVILDEHGLISAIRCFVENYQEKTDIKVTFYYNVKEEKIPINQTQKFYLFRIVKELLNNILKYAEATEVVISLLIVEDKFKLIVDDNGKGFDFKKYLRKSQSIEGIGLFTIKKWVEHFNGNLYVESQIGEGTRIIVELGSHNDKSISC